MFTPGAGFESTHVDDVQLIINRIKSLNPSAKISTVRLPGQKTSLFKNEILLKADDLPPPMDIRTFMYINPEQYFHDESFTFKPEGIQPEVHRKIREDGLYLGQLPEKSPLKKVLATITVPAEKLSFYNHIRDKIKHVTTKALSNSKMQEYWIGDKRVKIEKYLGSGLNGDAYLVNIEGRPIVFKISKSTTMARQSMSQANLVNQWISQKYDIAVPKLLDFDPEGKWQALEFIKGESLEKYIASHGGQIPKDMNEKLKKFHSETVRLNLTSNIKMDISAENIFINAAGNPVMVDFGPTQPYRRFDSDYEIAKARWVGAGKAILKNDPSMKSKCLKNAMVGLKLRYN